MLPKNWTTITEFIIVGFPGLHPDYYGLVSAIFFVVYMTTVAGNTVFLVLFITSERLSKPMYIILANLAMSDMCFSNVALPKIIARYWFNAGATPFHACFFQMELIHYFGTLNSLIMMIMALDRYVAICYSLRYQTVMTNRITYILNATVWVTAFIAPTITTLHSQQLPYCGPKLIVQCYCDHISIISLACAENSKQILVALCVALLVLLLPLAFIIYSYCHIIGSVMRLSSSQSRWKSFATCSTQLCIIALFYVPRCAVYIASFLQIQISRDFRILLILLYSLIPPLINPFIYCLRTQEIRIIVSQWVSRQKTFREMSRINVITL
ncbi:olfactory receptor 1-like [Carassius auratus]|uniref:Olfactory receptor n=1 Tax=Carassius auratus TaxID=7957 RepID=A0A6P6KUZ3_CARAU|nr:olfactory receptor 1-like [Carassius auratus]XP_026076130.1 olfactory receptor 1-like [Carassius auratus]XP_052463833.1 olfactory receptor 1-like [Carassius gibelio]